MIKADGRTRIYSGGEIHRREKAGPKPWAPRPAYFAYISLKMDAKSVGVLPEPFAVNF